MSEPGAVDAAPAPASTAQGGADMPDATCSVMVIARNLTHLRPVATCAGEDCLRIPVTCPCGATVAAGDGHDCSKPWGGYWLCECGHCTRHHNAWWDDMNGQSGMGCDVCDCGNPEEVT